MILKKIKNTTLFLLMFLIFSLSLKGAVDQNEGVMGPAVNTPITNQAILNYVGYDDEVRVMNSNIVITYVAQIYGLTFVSDQSVIAVPGDTVYFIHNLRNVGNGVDEYLITNSYERDIVGNYKYSYFISYDDDYSFSTELKDPYVITLESGQIANIKVAVVTDRNAVPTSTAFHYITATSKGDSSIYADVNENIRYTQDASVNVKKSLSKYSDFRLTDQVLTVTLEITNSSETAARSFSLTDVLDSKFRYVDGTDIYWQDFNSSKPVKIISGEENTFGSNKITFSTTTDPKTEVTTIGFKIVSTVSGVPEKDPTAEAVPGNITLEKGKGVLTFQVTVPKETALGNISNQVEYIYFDGSFERKELSNTVYYKVLPTRDVEITKINNGVVFIGGSIIYAHLVTNYGDVVEGDGVNSVFTITTTDSKYGWVSNLYVDSRYDPTATPVILGSNSSNIVNQGVKNYSARAISGGLDRTIIPTLIPFNGFSQLGGLAPGDSIIIYTAVISPSNSQINDINHTVLIPNISQGTYYMPPKYTSDASDTTIVVGDYMTIDKYQSKDPIEANYSKNNKWISPGERIYYKIVATNISSEVQAKNIVLYETIPLYTTLSAGKENSPGMDYLPSYIIKDSNGNIVKDYTLADFYPGIGMLGNIFVNINSLDPGHQVIFYFNVKIDT